MGIFRLYGTSACHLCELAEQILIDQCAESAGLRVESVDIADSDELFERYGLRIPVLQHPLGAELGWPFDPADVRLFVGLGTDSDR